MVLLFAEAADSKKTTGSLQKRMFGGYGLGGGLGFGGLGYGGLGYGGLGYGMAPFVGVYGSSSGASSSNYYNAGSAMGPFGGYSNVNAGSTSNSYNNAYGSGGMFFAKDVDAKKPTNVSFMSSF